MTQKPLTGTQADVLDYISRYARREGRSPTVREIGDQFGITSPNGVSCHLKALQKKGYIAKAAVNSSRGIKIVVPPGHCPCCGQAITTTPGKKK